MEYEEVTKTRKKTLRLPLKLNGPGFAMPKMTADQLKVRALQQPLLSGRAATRDVPGKPRPGAFRLVLYCKGASVLY